MKNYELLYILSSNFTSKEIADNFKDIKENIEKLGAKMLVTLVDHPFLVKAETSKEEEAEELKGLTIVKKKLAYPIKKNKFGFYCLVNFAIEGKDLSKIDKYLTLNNNVLRFIIVQDNPMTPDELALLHKLFARKRAEQEKEEKEKEMKEVKEEKREIRAEREAPREAVKEVKEKKEIKEEKKEEKVEAPKAEEKVKAEVKEEKKKEPAKKERGEKETPKEERKEEKTEEPTEAKEEKKKEDKRRKKKIKLEDLEDKLDEILEDTMI